MADLIFRRPPYTGGPVNLVFGAGSDIAPAEVVGTVVLGGVSVSGLVQFPPQPAPSTVVGTLALGGVTITGLALYDNKNPRRATTAAVITHQVGTPAEIMLGTGWQPATRQLDGTRTAWQTATPRPQQVDTGHQVGTKTAQQAAPLWQLGSPRVQQFAHGHQTGTPVAMQTAQPWGLGSPRAVQFAHGHQVAQSWVAQALQLWQLAQHLHRAVTGKQGPGVARSAGLLPPWQVARKPPSGFTPWVPPVDPTPPQRVPNLDLVFACPPWVGGPVNLVFGHVCTGIFGPQAPLYILPARYYMAVHTLTAHRLPDLQALPIFGIQLGADMGSYAWSFSATGPLALLDLLSPFDQVRITLNGMPWVFLVDKISRTEAFGQRQVRIQGRSATALLGQPYSLETARTNSLTATAQQLANAALDLTGFTLDWGLTDWLVPPGAFSHSGTPLAAVQAIAEAAGGYVQSHRSAPTLLARHPYPTLPNGQIGAPWNWGGTFAADVDLATSAIITLAEENASKYGYNAVFVSGTTQGVLALVKRAGTAGDKLAQHVTDPLITAQEVALQRGLTVLGAAGQKMLVELSLPVLNGPTDPGVLDVGQLVQINQPTPWRGRVRAVSVSATLPKVRQTVTLERHLEDA